MKHLLSILILCLFTSCYQIERNCTDFKTGTFEFNYSIDGVEKKGTFIRTETLNIDHFNNKIDSASIRWINDCEFIQKKINPKSMEEEKAIHFKILSTTKDSYTFEYQLAVKNPYKKQRVEQASAKKID